MTTETDTGWYRSLRNDPSEQDQELLGLLGSDDFTPPVASMLHFVSCEGISQVHAELVVAGRTLTFYMNTRDAKEVFHSLASSTGVSETLYDAVTKEKI